VTDHDISPVHGLPAGGGLGRKRLDDKEEERGNEQEREATRRTFTTSSKTELARA